jgi:hypothetical protein
VEATVLGHLPESEFARTNEKTRAVLFEQGLFTTTAANLIFRLNTFPLLLAFFVHVVCRSHLADSGRAIVAHFRSFFEDQVKIFLRNQ